MIHILAQQFIGPSTGITIGAACGVGVFVIAVVLKVNNRIGHIENTIGRLGDSMKETWSRKDQEIYSLKLQLHNPTLRVPDVASIGVDRNEEQS